MRYIPVTCEQREAMLRAVGVSSVDELFAVVPEAVRLDGASRPARAARRDRARLRICASLAGEQRSRRRELVSFLGAGCYDHYIPSVVDHVVSQAGVLHRVHAVPARGQSRARCRPSTSTSR